LKNSILSLILGGAAVYRFDKHPFSLLALAADGPVPNPLLFLIPASLTVELSMQSRTDTLEIGSRAPDFSLGAANREGTFTLSGLIEKGTLILEFLRGTW
jgi:hypothetical protein